MASILDSKFGVGLACAVAVAIGAGGVVWLQRAGAPHTEPAAAPAPAVSAWDRPIGPGTLSAASSAGAGAATLANAGEGAALTDAGGQLLVDRRLHSMFDGYLAKAGAPARQAGAVQLRAELKRRLAQPALGQAEALMDSYLRYLQAEDAMRARERFTPPDPSGLSEAQVDQMLAWQQQRAQLRERMLGTAVAQAWFGADDALCQTALADWRKMRAPADSDEVDSNELRARRLHGAVLEERRNEQAQSCAGQLMAGLAQSG